MKNLATLICALFAFGIGSVQAQTEGNDYSKATFILKIDDKEHTIAESDELELNGVKYAVKLADYKVFETPMIAFEYPSHFSVEHKWELGVDTWTFNGMDFVLFLFEFGVDIELDAFVNDLVKQFGKRNSKVEKTKIKIGDQTLSGKRIKVSLIGQKLNYDVLEVKLSDGRTRFIAFQDTPEENGKPSTESLETIEMIRESIQYN